jgi:ATP-dependent protease HslVU (ClpYQ) peptidase subunit
MTTIVAIQGPDWAAVGSDSRVTDEGRIYTMPKGYSKVSENRDYLLGAAGDMRAINILEHAFVPPHAADVEDKELDTFITIDFIPALRKCFEEHGYADGSMSKNDDSKDASSFGSSVLAIVNGTVYEIGEDYSWVKDSAGVYALGTGGDYVLGAVHAMLPAKGKLTADIACDILKKALAIAAKLDAGSSGPFNVTVQEKP